MHTQHNGHPPLFRLGILLITPGAILALVEANQSALAFLMRHAYADWGELEQEDKQANDIALSDGGRLFSAYTLSTGQRLWIITEANRSATTLLIPMEY